MQRIEHGAVWAPVPDTAQGAATVEGQVVGREYRCCRRCWLHEARPAQWLISAGSEHRGGGAS